MNLETSITGPVAVIGDVHGQVEHLTRLLDQLKAMPDYDRRWIVFIGDICDRGPDTKGAFDIILDLIEKHPRTTAVSGNHELAMAGALGCIEAPPHTEWAGRWLDHYGSASTFESYGVSNVEDLDALRAAVPDAHRDYLASLSWCVDHPEYFFVHAGLEPHLPFEMQHEILVMRDYTLNRPQWLCSKQLVFEDPPRDCRKAVVSGHAQVPEVRFAPRRILIDTTGGAGGSMSCVLLPENQVLHSHPEYARDPIRRDTARRQTAEEAKPKKKGWLW